MTRAERKVQILMPARLHARLVEEQQRRGEPHRSRLVAKLTAEALGDESLAELPSSRNRSLTGDDR